MIPALLFPACASLQERFEGKVDQQLARPAVASETVVTQADLEHLPAPVATYVQRSGAVGKPQVRNFRVDFDATMYRKPDQPLRSKAVQYSFLESPSRYFFLTTRMMGLPVAVLHAYEKEHAAMQVRVAGVYNMVNQEGGPLNQAETVTMLNDICVMAPALLVDPRFAWTALDNASARVAFTNGGQRVTATLFFDAQGDLVDFSSDDRHALEDDGQRWSTPLTGYQEFEGRRVAALGKAVWHYQDRPDFMYGEFVIRALRYNVSGPRPAP